MFGMGMAEIVVIAIVALLFLGPDKLPEAAKKLSKGVRELRSHSRELKQALQENEEIGGVVRDLKSTLRDIDIREPFDDSRSRRSRDNRPFPTDDPSPTPASEKEASPGDQSQPEESEVAQTDRRSGYKNVSIRFYLSPRGSSLAQRLKAEVAAGVTTDDGTFEAEGSETFRIRDDAIDTFEEGDAERLLQLLKKLYDATDLPPL